MPDLTKMKTRKRSKYSQGNKLCFNGHDLLLKSFKVTIQLNRKIYNSKLINWLKEVILFLFWVDCVCVFNSHKV